MKHSSKGIYSEFDPEGQFVPYSLSDLLLCQSLLEILSVDAKRNLELARLA